MELFLVHKRNFHRLFAEDEFFYPLVFQTPLLQARYVGHQAKAMVAAWKKPLEGVFLGVASEPLYDYLKQRLPRQTLSETLAAGDAEEGWLEQNTRHKTHFEGVKYVSNPANPPYKILVSDLSHFVLLSSFSENELEDFKAGFNLVITNEAIEALTSLVKRRLPYHVEKAKPAKHSPVVPATFKGRQAHLRRFVTP